MGYLNLAGQPKAGHYFSLACALLGPLRRRHLQIRWAHSGRAVVPLCVIWAGVAQLPLMPSTLSPVIHQRLREPRRHFVFRLRPVP